MRGSRVMVAGLFIVLVLVVLVVLVVLDGCARPPHYQLSGQVLAIDVTRQEITIKHGDIVGFMPGMTMTFKVKDRTLIEGRTPGDLVTATLLVEGAVGYLIAMERTGHSAATEPPLTARGLSVLELGALVPDTVFTDESGARHTLSEWRGRVLAVTFIYTRCPLPDFCPRMNRNFEAVQHAVLADARLRDRVHLLSVTFDPVADTPAVLARQAQRHGARPEVWSFVTGEPESIERFVSQFGVSMIREGGTPTEVVHNLKTAVIGADGRVIGVLSGNLWTPDDLLTLLRSGA